MPKHGESIWKRKDGRWEARYIRDRDATGKALYSSVYGKTYSEVKKKRNDIIDELKSNESKKMYPTTTFGNIIFEFLKEHKTVVKESTYVRYVEIANSHLIQEIGEQSITDFSQENADKYIMYLLTYGKKDGTGLAKKTVKDIISVLKLIIKYAIKRGYCPSNTITFSIPKLEKNEVQVLSVSQRKKLEGFVTSRNDSYMFGVFVCLYTGLRIGEICALQWKDVDLINSTISVNKTVLRIKNITPNATTKTRLIMSSPKTASSKRVIPIPRTLSDMLLNIRKKSVSENDYVLTGMNYFIEPRNYYERYKRYLKECHIIGFDFHALRHTFATRCIEAGIDPKVLSEILGHASVRITLDLYVHPSDEIKRTSLEKLFS